MVICEDTKTANKYVQIFNKNLWKLVIKTLI